MLSTAAFLMEYFLSHRLLAFVTLVLTGDRAGKANVYDSEDLREKLE